MYCSGLHVYNWHVAFHPSNASPIYIQNLNFVTIVPANVPVPSSARPSAAAALTYQKVIHEFSKFLWLLNILDLLYPPLQRYSFGIYVYWFEVWNSVFWHICILVSRLSVCPSICGQNDVHSVSSTILAGSIAGVLCVSVIAKFQN